MPRPLCLQRSERSMWRARILPSMLISFREAVRSSKEAARMLGDDCTITIENGLQNVVRRILVSFSETKAAAGKDMRLLKYAGSEERHLLCSMYIRRVSIYRSVGGGILDVPTSPRSIATSTTEDQTQSGNIPLPYQ